MLTFNPEDHLITHAGCMDGATCALVFRRFGGNPNNIHFSSPSHEKVDPLVIQNRKNHKGNLYLADISMSDRYAILMDGRTDIHIYDHHKSAIPLTKYRWCHINVENTACGSKVFYEACMKGRVYVEETKWRHLPGLIDAVDDRDRWINQNEYSADLSELFSLLGQDAFIQRCWEHPEPWLQKDEFTAVLMERQRKELYIERLKPVVRNVNGYQVGFVFCEQRFTSDAGHAMCDKFDLDCCVLVNLSAVSLRAPENSPLDLSVIAKKYGGGGHKGAAGFQLSALLGEPVLDSVVKQFTIDKQ